MSREENQERVGGILKRARLAAGMTLAQVEQATEISTAQLSRIENGMEDIKLSVLQTLLAAYHTLTRAEFDHLWSLIRGLGTVGSAYQYETASAAFLAAEDKLRSGEQLAALPILEVALDLATDQDDKANGYRLIGAGRTGLGDYDLAEASIRRALSLATDPYLVAKILANLANALLEKRETKLGLAVLRDLKHQIALINEKKPAARRDAWKAWGAELVAYVPFLEALYSLVESNDPQRLQEADSMIVASADELEKIPDQVSLAGWVRAHRALVLGRVGDKNAAVAANRIDLAAWGPGEEGKPKDPENYALALLIEAQLHGRLEPAQQAHDLACQKGYATLRDRAAYLIAEFNARRVGHTLPYWAIVAIACLIGIVASPVVGVAVAVAKDLI